MRPSERTLPALAAMRAALTDVVRSEAPDLTSRQLALLLTVFMAPGPHTIRALAAVLGLPKPAVTRALDRLEELDFVKRRRDASDRRSVEACVAALDSVLERDAGRVAAVLVEPIVQGAGGMRILDKIERLDYDTLHARPTIGRRDLPVLAAATIRRRR